MSKQIITNEAYNMIRKLATNDLVHTGVQQPNGDWMISVSEHVLNSVFLIMLDGETLSDAIIRLGMLYQHKLH